MIDSMKYKNFDTSLSKSYQLYKSNLLRWSDM